MPSRASSKRSTARCAAHPSDPHAGQLRGAHACAMLATLEIQDLSALVHAEQACFWQYFGQADGVPVLLQDACNVGDEGGFAPNIASNEEGLNLVNQAIEVCKNASEQSSCANHLYKPHTC